MIWCVDRRPVSVAELVVTKKVEPALSLMPCGQIHFLVECYIPLEPYVHSGKYPDASEL